MMASMIFADRWIDFADFGRHDMPPYRLNHNGV